MKLKYKANTQLHEKTIINEIPSHAVKEVLTETLHELGELYEFYRSGKHEKEMKKLRTLMLKLERIRERLK